MPDNMDPRTALIMSSFDIRKLSRACNAHGCDSPPAKQVNVSEFDARTTRKKELVTLYFCSKHYTGLDAFLERLKGLCGKGAIIHKEVFDIGCVTY